MGQMGKKSVLWTFSTFYFRFKIIFLFYYPPKFSQKCFRLIEKIKSTVKRQCLLLKNLRRMGLRLGRKILKVLIMATQGKWTGTILGCLVNPSNGPQWRECGLVGRKFGKFQIKGKAKSSTQRGRGTEAGVWTVIQSWETEQWSC